MSRVLRNALLVVAAVLPLHSCAILREENRPVLEWMDDTLSPADATTRVALSPLILPVGLLGGVADAAFYRPATSLDDAWCDTEDMLWDYDSDSDSDFWTVLYTPFAAALTPFAFAGSWGSRILFPVPDHEDLREEEEIQPNGEPPIEPVPNEGGPR